MTTYHLTGTATDTMGAVASGSLTFTSTAAAPPRVVKRSFMEHRISWGSVIDQSPKGPTFSDVTQDGTANAFGHTSPPYPVTLGLTFEVLSVVRLTGCRIYKAPNATGTAIPVKLWSGTGTEVATATIPSWVVDVGGWRQVTFSSPVTLTPGTLYTIGYFAPDGIFSWSPWVWHAQDTCVWPLLNHMFNDASSGASGGSVNGWDDPGGTIIFPTHHIASNYYIDPQVEWDEPMPAYPGGTGYWDQWTNPASVGSGRHAFPVAVFFSDPEYLADYYDAGINTLVAGAPVGDSGKAYIDAHNAMGNTMDWYGPAFFGDDPAGIVRVMTDEPGVAAQIVGYHLDDEPDMSIPYRPPSLLQTWASGLRSVDSTRPIALGMGRLSLRNQSFQWAPQGASAQTVNELWRQWTAIADLITCDDYTLTPDQDTLGGVGHLDLRVAPRSHERHHRHGQAGVGHRRDDVADPEQAHPRGGAQGGVGHAHRWRPGHPVLRPPLRVGLRDRGLRRHAARRADEGDGHRAVGPSTVAGSRSARTRGEPRHRDHELEHDVGSDGRDDGRPDALHDPHRRWAPVPLRDGHSAWCDDGHVHDPVVVRSDCHGPR